MALTGKSAQISMAGQSTFLIFSAEIFQVLSAPWEAKRRISKSATKSSASARTGQEGTYAEKIAMDQKLVALKPSNLSHLDAASLALIGLTAIVSIEDCLQLQKDEKILIQGGAGGVAGFAIQLAKHIGAYVITTTSATNSDYVKALGADEVIDYKTQDFTEIVSDCDAVFDTVGGDVAMRSFEVIKIRRAERPLSHQGSRHRIPREEDVQIPAPRMPSEVVHAWREWRNLASNGVVKIPEPTNIQPLPGSGGASNK